VSIKLIKAEKRLINADIEVIKAYNDLISEMKDKTINLIDRYQTMNKREFSKFFKLVELETIFDKNELSTIEGYQSIIEKTRDQCSSDLFEAKIEYQAIKEVKDMMLRKGVVFNGEDARKFLAKYCEDISKNYIEGDGDIEPAGF